jgi:hypothetical protein
VGFDATGERKCRGHMCATVLLDALRFMDRDRVRAMLGAVPNDVLEALLNAIPLEAVVEKQEVEKDDL